MSVALKAYRRIGEAWGLTAQEADALIGPDDDDQILRLSAVLGIYKGLETCFSEPLARTWFTRPNIGPLFEGQRPIDSAIEGRLPQLLRIRRHIEDLIGPREDSDLALAELAHHDQRDGLL